MLTVKISLPTHWQPRIYGSTKSRMPLQLYYISNNETIQMMTVKISMPKHRQSTICCSITMRILLHLYSILNNEVIQTMAVKSDLPKSAGEHKLEPYIKNAPSPIGTSLQVPMDGATSPVLHSEQRGDPGDDRQDYLAECRQSKITWSTTLRMLLHLSAQVSRCLWTV